MKNEIIRESIISLRQEGLKFSIDTLGDYVVVPVGKDNHHSVAEVVKVEYFAEEDVPLPLDRTKHIIRKCTDDDFDPPVVNEEVD